MEFPSAQSYWRFASSVSREWRYTRNDEQTAFLAAVLSTSVSRQEILPEGATLWRAQEGCEWPGTGELAELDPGPRPYGTSRMKPLPDRAAEGRVNPRGIPCLYAATHRRTAVAEVRPWVGAHVSVAQLRTLRPLKLVNCTPDDQNSSLVGAEAGPEEREQACWLALDRAFSRPVERSEQLAEYVPTQIIAEMFRKEGFDGIKYRSSLGPGRNVALFDLDAADVVSCGVFEVRGVRFEMEAASNPYFVISYFPDDASREAESRRLKDPAEEE